PRRSGLGPSASCRRRTRPLPESHCPERHCLEMRCSGRRCPAPRPWGTRCRAGALRAALRRTRGSRSWSRAPRYLRRLIASSTLPPGWTELEVAAGAEGTAGMGEIADADALALAMADAAGEPLRTPANDGTSFFAGLEITARAPATAVLVPWVLVPRV